MSPACFAERLHCISQRIQRRSLVRCRGHTKPNSINSPGGTHWGYPTPPGDHRVAVDTAKAPIAGLPEGDYHVVLEAAREVGGREIVRIPFTWPPKAAETLRVQGEHELGAVVLDLKP